MKKESRYKLYMAFGWTAFLGLVLQFVFLGENFELLKGLFSGNFTEAELRETIESFGWHGCITVSLLAALQVICAFFPAEPVQVLAGLSYGFPVGLLLCWLGVLLGNTAIFLLHKALGEKLDDLFENKLHLERNKISQSKKCVLIIFILYFLPAIPYGLICFFAATVGMRYRKYIVVTALGALPSICIGVGLGHVAIASNWLVSVGLFMVLLILLAVMVAKRDFFFSSINRYAEKHKKSSRFAVRETNGFLLGILYFSLRFYYFLCGVRIKAVNKIGKPEKPAIILCNHGSFIDFIFAAKLLRKYKPNFIIARLYFYDKRLRWMLRNMGGFPKSMFALDMESTKNCLTVLKNGGILAMMPEARLATTGRFEDIQPSTYSFLKKSGVPVYTIKFHGDYFADPKWGKGFRRGAVVEAELDILFTAEQVKNLSAAQIQDAVIKRLDYNEFEWIQERPNLHYKSGRMAEGLENILTVCPKCRDKHTITTRKDKIYCEKCGYLTSLDSRYLFTGDFRFADLTQWYDWQKGLMEQEIAANPDFSMESAVELRLPSDGKGLTRSAGRGVCKLSRAGLQYCGTKDGETVEIHFPLDHIYRLLFGAGVNFETYNGTEILFFVPDEKRSAVDWYIASMILYDEAFPPK